MPCADFSRTSPIVISRFLFHSAAGVVQIITKKGRAGTNQVDATMRTGANYAHNLENRIPLNYYLKPDGTIVSQNLIKSERERGTPLFRTGLIQNYGVGLRGGQQKYTYYLSADYTDEEGYDWENAQKKGSLRSNLQLAASDQLDISADLGMLKTDANVIVTFEVVLSVPGT